MIDSVNADDYMLLKLGNNFLSAKKVVPQFNKQAGVRITKATKVE